MTIDRRTYSGPLTAAAKPPFAPAVYYEDPVEWVAEFVATLDLRTLSDASLKILCTHELISVNQVRAASRDRAA